MKNLKILFVLLLTLLLAACAHDKTVRDPGAAFKGQTARQIYVGGEQGLIHGDFGAAVKHFEALNVLHPFGRYARQGQLNIIYAYYKNGDVASTLAAADRYIHLYPMSPNVDYAYYMRGIAEFYENRGVLEKYFNTDYAQRALQPLQQSFDDFSHLVYHYPHSKYTPDARQRMIYIRNILAEHNLEVAKFYYDREAYVAAANRSNEVIQHYQQSLAVPGALILATESYTKLKDYADAKQTLSVLKLNFPHNPYITKLEKNLQKIKHS